MKPENHTSRTSARDVVRRWKRGALGLSALFALGALIGTRAAEAAPACLTFEGLVHCPLGGATLGLVKGQLAVDKPVNLAQAGVSIDVPDVHSWQGAMTIDFAGEASGVFRADSLSEGVVTSQAQVRRTPAGDLLTAAFTGSSEKRLYRVDVLLNGALSGSEKDIPSGLGAPGSSHGVLALINEYDVVWEFIVQPNGACQWGHQFRSAPPSGVSITLPNGVQVMGDEIRMTEQVKPAGGYPYTTFDGLVFYGTFAGIDVSTEVIE